MGDTYKVTATTLAAPAAGVLLRLSFGTPAQNDQIVRDARQAIADLALGGGEIVLLNGPASLPVAVVVAHAIAHRYSAVGVFDPKMAGYVISIAHGGRWNVGDVIPASEVVEG